MAFTRLRDNFKFRNVTPRERRIYVTFTRLRDNFKFLDQSIVYRLPSNVILVVGRMDSSIHTASSAKSIQGQITSHRFQTFLQ